jgi:hypothetical protein
MRSQVQVLAGPPAIPAGHSAAGSEPGTPAVSLGRAGAASPSPSASPSALAGPSTPTAGATTITHRGRPPNPRAAATRQARPPRAAACSRATAPPQRRALRTPAWPARSLSVTRGRRRPATTPARFATDPTDQRAGSAAAPAPGLLGRRPSRSTARQPTGTSTVPVVTVAWRTGLGGTSRRVRTDGADSRRPDTRRWTADGRTAGSPDDEPSWPDTTRPPRIPDDTGWVDTACWTSTGDRRHGWRPGSVDHGDDARPLDAGWTLRPGRHRLGEQQQLSTKHYQDGPDHGRGSQLQVRRRRPAGALAHCCPQTISGRA